MQYVVTDDWLYTSHDSDENRRIMNAYRVSARWHLIPVLWAFGPAFSHKQRKGTLE